MIRRRDALYVLLGASLAFATRLVSNVLTRPEFVGWFNHSTYYWVQTRSLIQDGQLAYEDMPLLFVLYAKLAMVGIWLGQPLDDAIVTSSRLLMAITPALVPVAMFLIARQANGSSGFRWPTWCLIVASGFLPLTYANMPETLQKNMLGLLLLAFALVFVLRWLADKRVSGLVVALLLAALIVFVHLGSALAVLLLVAGITLEMIFSASSRNASLRPLLFSLVIAAAIVFGIATFYPGAMNRVRELSDAFVPTGVLNGLAILAVLAAWLAVLWFFRRWIARKQSSKDPAVSRLMRIVFLWAGLLALPLWPGEIGIRLLLYIPLALVVFLILLLSQVRDHRRLTVAGTITATVFFLMSVGEAVSMFMIYPNKHEISREMSALKNKYQLAQDDLVITPYGVNPTANWFLGTKASLLTAVSNNAISNYDRVFVLNTLERPAPALEPDTCQTFTTESDRYWMTRHDIPLGDLEADAEFQTLAFFELQSFPANWTFADDGIWKGWCR